MKINKTVWRITYLIRQPEDENEPEAVNLLQAEVGAKTESAAVMIFRNTHGESCMIVRCRRKR